MLIRFPVKKEYQLIKSINKQTFEHKMPKKTNKDTGTIKVTQFKSAIGYHKRQKRTIEALGIRRIGQIKEHKDTPVIRGMVRKVSHLVRIIEG